MFIRLKIVLERETQSNENAVVLSYTRIYIALHLYQLHTHCRYNLTRGFGKKSRKLENQNEVSKIFLEIMQISCCTYYCTVPYSIS